MFRVGHNQMYTECICYFEQGDHQSYSHIQCMYLCVSGQPCICPRLVKGCRAIHKSQRRPTVFWAGRPPKLQSYTVHVPMRFWPTLYIFPPGQGMQCNPQKPAAPHGVLSRETTKVTVIYSGCIRVWPTLHLSPPGQGMQCNPQKPAAPHTLLVPCT